jgi:hypothetical protein
MTEPDPDEIGPDGTVRLRCYVPALAKQSEFPSAVTLGRRDGGDGQTATQHYDAAGPFV